jgi:hypothetical protein
MCQYKIAVNHASSGQVTSSLTGLSGYLGKVGGAVAYTRWQTAKVGSVTPILSS